MKTCREIAEETGARLTLTADVDEGVKGADYLYTDVWVSMGEDKSVWKERIDLLKPYQINADVLARTENPQAKFMHCLPALHNRDTEVGEDIFQTYGLDGLEVTDEVFESAALDRLRPGREPDAHHQGDHGRHPRIVRRPPCAWSWHWRTGAQHQRGDVSPSPGTAECTSGSLAAGDAPDLSESQGGSSTNTEGESRWVWGSGVRSAGRSAASSGSR